MYNPFEVILAIVYFGIAGYILIFLFTILDVFVDVLRVAEDKRYPSSTFDIFWLLFIVTCLASAGYLHFFA